MKINELNIEIGHNKPSFIIAEAGVNHNGSLKNAFRLVDVAKKANVNAIKFQTFKAKNLVADSAPLAEYQKSKENNQSQ